MENEEVNETGKKKHKKREVVFNIFIILLSIVALGVAGVLIYQKRYLTPFWVNGQSMYPTLNKNATNGIGETLGFTGTAEVGSKWIEYGVMDKHDSALKGIKRFDIVICTFKQNDETDKIKRVVGLPGETIKFGQGEDLGSLYVKNGDSFTFVKQPLKNEYVATGSYPTSEITLGNDEYYVLGDNRAHSSDSRNNGNIKSERLVGKVVAICAYCEIRQGENGLEPYKIQHFPPRFL